jgi:hypothetical protein
MEATGEMETAKANRVVRWIISLLAAKRALCDDQNNSISHSNRPARCDGFKASVVLPSK